MSLENKQIIEFGKACYNYGEAWATTKCLHTFLRSTLEENGQLDHYGIHFARENGMYIYKQAIVQAWRCRQRVRELKKQLIQA